MTTQPDFKGRHRAFTLLELLMVIAMMAVLMSLTVMGVGSLRHGQDLANAGNQLVDTINQARQSSRASNRPTALVLIKDQAPMKRFNAFTIYEQLPGSAEWRQLSRWRDLPEGTIFDESESSALTDPSSLPTPPAQISRGSYAVPVGDYSYQVFLPDGRLLPSASGGPPKLSLRSEHGGANFYRIVLNSNIGTPIVERP